MFVLFGTCTIIVTYFVKFLLTTRHFLMKVRLSSVNQFTSYITQHHNIATSKVDDCGGACKIKKGVSASVLMDKGGQ